MYSTVFPEEEFAPDADVTDKSKVYKIKYSVNLLGQVGKFCYPNEDDPEELEVANEDINLMSLCEETEELCMF
jgi:hypothetical protein